jgi:hypothetical protein
VTLAAILGTLIIVGVTIVFAVFLERRRPKPAEEWAVEQRAVPKLALGETPATSFKVGDAQLAKLRVTQRCPTCRGEMSDIGDDQVRYDERDLLVLHFACSKCQTKRTLYVEHRA